MPDTPRREIARIPIASLAGGISQQPPQVRFENQVQDATNMMFSAGEHCVKRPGTRLTKVLSSAPSASANVRIRSLDRDETEQYVVTIQNNGTVRVFPTNVGWPEATVNVTSGASTYLANGSPTADDFRMVSIADSTIIVNTKVATGSTTSDAYGVTRTHRDYQAMLSHTPSDETYHLAREDLDGLPGGYFKYDVDGKTFAKWTFPAPAATWSDLDTWRDDANNPFGFTIRFQVFTAVASGTASYSAGTNKLVATVGTPFADLLAYGLPNGQIFITGGTGVTADAYPIKQVDSSTQIELFDDIAGAGSPTDVSFDGIGIEYEFSVDLRQKVITSLTDVALAIQDALRDAGAADALVSYEGGAGGAGAGGYFVVTSPYRGSQAKINSIASPSVGTDLTNAAGEPFNGGSGTAGTGSSASAPTLSPSLRWTRVAAPSQSEAVLDQTKMPVQMVRTTIGDSVTPAVFDIDLIDWTQRTSGDKVTNPVPAFVSEETRIDDVSYHRGRLVFLAGEHISFSQSDDLFNFFRETDDDTIDSDPINLRLSTDRVTLGRYLVTFRKTLAGFTRAGQMFEVIGGDTLTPTNASVVPTVNHYTQDVRPVVLDNLMYAVGSEAGRAQLLELFYDDAAVATLPQIVTEHVRTLLPASVRTIAGHANSKTVFVIGKDGRTIYAYKSYWNGNQKQLSSWTEYELASGNRICDIMVSRDRLYMLIERNSQYVIESLAVTSEVADINLFTGAWAYPIHLDRREYLTGVHSAGTTTWTTTQNTTGLNAIVLGSQFGGSSGTVLTPTVASSTTLTVAGDHSAGEACVGRLFDTSVVPTRPFIRNEGDKPDNDWTLSIQKFTVAYRDSGPFTVTHAPGQGRTDRTYTFTPTSLTESGEFSASVFGSAALGTVTISSTNARPLQIAGIQWEGVATR